MGVLVELAGLYVDLFETGEGEGLYVENRLPEGGSTAIAVDAPVQFDLIAATAAEVDPDNTSIYVAGALAWQNGSFQSGFSGTVSEIGHPVSSHDLRFVINHAVDWTSEQLIAVRVVSQTIGATQSCDVSYSFTVVDVTAPRLLSALGLSALVVRVTFDDGMLRSSALGEHDALNPANYSFSFVPATDRQAGVAVSAVSVSAVSASEFDVTLNWEATFWKTYRLTCGEIYDDAGNTLDPDYNSTTFSSWVPPSWPVLRSFDLWSMLSKDDRDGDVQGDLERFISSLQDVVDVLLYDIDAFDQLWDIDRAPESFIDALLQDLGNPFFIGDLTSNKKRKLADILVSVYRQFGTKPSIVNMCRFLLGVEVTVTACSDYAWILGVTELEVGSWLAPDSGTRWPYTFHVNSPVELTEAQEVGLQKICRRCKAAHEHFIITDPSTGLIDHLELELSELGTEWIVHL